MNRKQKIKLAGISSLLILLGLAAFLVLYALKQNINLFYTPSQLVNVSFNTQQTLRIGGFVKKNSVHYANSGSGVSFSITDAGTSLIVHFNGVLPNLFREGQGVVLTGKRLTPTEFQASEVLAKHDEKYVPRYLLTAKEKVA